MTGERSGQLDGRRVAPRALPLTAREVAIVVATAVGLLPVFLAVEFWRDILGGRADPLLEPLSRLLSLLMEWPLTPLTSRLPHPTGETSFVVWMTLWNGLFWGALLSQVVTRGATIRRAMRALRD